MATEGVRFWLKNKQIYGVLIATQGDERLVTYHSRLYVVKGDSPVMKGGRPLYYTNSSLPAKWKHAMNGGMDASGGKIRTSGAMPLSVTPAARPSPSSSGMDVMGSFAKTGSVILKEETSLPIEQEPAHVKELETNKTREGDSNMEGKLNLEKLPNNADPGDTAGKKEKSGSKRAKRTDGVNKGSKTDPVEFVCPYCTHKAEAPPSRKDGKPFFHTCVKCSKEFAIRLVPITIYKAEIAAFGK